MALYPRLFILLCRLFDNRFGIEPCNTISYPSIVLGVVAVLLETLLPLVKLLLVNFVIILKRVLFCGCLLVGEVRVNRRPCSLE